MDMTVNVIGTNHLAERACRMVFGEDADLGPVRPAPEPLRAMLADWPGRTDQAHQVALELPITFDIGKDMGKNQAKAVVLVVCRVTVLHQGRKVGYAIRTDQAGLNAIALWETSWEQFKSRLRQAH